MCNKPITDSTIKTENGKGSYCWLLLNGELMQLLVTYIVQGWVKPVLAGRMHSTWKKTYCQKS